MNRRFLVNRAANILKQVNYWLVAQLALGIIRVLRLFPADGALNFIDRAARRIGPLFGRHRVAIDNLRQAYPEKSDAEIAAVASDMWGNMARLAAEYVFLDKLFDYDPQRPGVGRIDAHGVEFFEGIAGENRPHIIFTAHMGNFELLPVAGASFGMKVASMFRPPNNPYIADFIGRTRQSRMGELVASRRGVSLELARILERNGTIGILVDQKFSNGVLTRFFGRECETSPLLAKLARQFDCDVYPAHCRRLPGNRFRMEIENKIELPRGEDGRVDVPRTTQLLNDIVERWVREDPGQWMWFHKRWQLSGGHRSRAPAKPSSQA